ncbi:MAG: SDR family NAD(P)-dependent oxidoreductase [Acidobacteria bacterium]|nr:SDR family NAD(P)-dependent oxidoreductase [Acidobacteriota bacterium]
MPEPVVAYRGAERWLQAFAPRRLESAAADWLAPGGAYLITGGHGRIGEVVARSIAAAVPGAKLVLVGRTPLPPRQSWREPRGSGGREAAILRQVLELEALGAEVMPAAADVADPAALAAVVADARRRFGRIRGVVHAAGDPGEQRLAVCELTATSCAAQWRAKVQGALALRQALRGEDPDFCVLLSSLAAVLGGLGAAAYCAANLWLDAFARAESQRTGRRWLAIGWDAWRFAASAPPPAVVASAARSPELALSPEEGAEAFARIVASAAAPHVVVSTGDLEGRLDRWIRLESLRGAAAADGRGPATLGTRGSLTVPYVAARNDLEAAMVGIWEELLGIEQIGIHDDFFELGGHSLLAIQLKSRLRGAFEVEPSLRELFDKPTVAALAEAMESEMIARLESLSEEESERLLVSAAAGPTGGADGTESR